MSLWTLYIVRKLLYFRESRLVFVSVGNLRLALANWKQPGAETNPSQLCVTQC